MHIVSDIPKEDSDMWDSWFLSLTKQDWAYRISFVRTLNGAEVNRRYAYIKLRLRARLDI